MTIKFASPNARMHWIVCDEHIVMERRGVYFVTRHGRVLLTGPSPLCIDGSEYRRRTKNRRRR